MSIIENLLKVSSTEKEKFCEKYNKSQIYFIPYCETSKCNLPYISKYTPDPRDFWDGRYVCIFDDPKKIISTIDYDIKHQLSRYYAIHMNYLWTYGSTNEDFSISYYGYDESCQQDLHSVSIHGKCFGFIFADEKGLGRNWRRLKILSGPEMRLPRDLSLDPEKEKIPVPSKDVEDVLNSMTRLDKLKLMKSLTKAIDELIKSINELTKELKEGLEKELKEELIDDIL